MEAIAGLQKIQNGSIIYYDDEKGEEELVGKTPLEISDIGVALSFVPEDRLGMGLVANMDLTDNVMLRSYRDGKGSFLNRKTPKNMTEEIVDELKVVTPSLQTPIRKLSGGNVQKVLVGREIANAPSVLMTAYAVRGLDINTSYTIYHLINKQKELRSSGNICRRRPGRIIGTGRQDTCSLCRKGKRHSRRKNDDKRENRTYDDKAYRGGGIIWLSAA